MDLGLDGRRALVTGSSAGLGEAIAERLAAEGAAVVVHGRDAERTEAVAERLREAGALASTAIGDLAEDGDAARVADAALAAGPIDILVNNAGTYDHRAWSESTANDWARTYNTNVISAIRMIDRLVPPMRERGWGRVVQIGGALAQQPIATMPEYSATLAARHNLAGSLARDLAGTGVTSNVVAPGGIRVARMEAMLGEAAPEMGWGDAWEEIEAGAVRDLAPNNIGRFGRPGEVAAAVAYLASDHADYVSGEVLRVDGGTVRTI
jgi:NAD(P)-dependent dehydrogenase (short-subunit alcohol dehydrogenase family)